MRPTSSGPHRRSKQHPPTRGFSSHSQRPGSSNSARNHRLLESEPQYDTSKLSTVITLDARPGSAHSMKSQRSIHPSTFAIGEVRPSSSHSTRSERSIKNIRQKAISQTLKVEDARERRKNEDGDPLSSFERGSFEKSSSDEGEVLSSSNPYL